MEELRISFRESEKDNINTIMFFTDNCWTRHIFQINKDFKIKSSKIPFPGYYIVLTEKKILDLKQFKMEII